MLFTDKCQNFATDRILEAAFYIDTERGNYMKTIVVCDDVEIERLLLKEILCQYFEEINEEVSIVIVKSPVVIHPSHIASFSKQIHPISLCFLYAAS